MEVRARVLVKQHIRVDNTLRNQIFPQIFIIYMMKLREEVCDNCNRQLFI